MSIAAPSSASAWACHAGGQVGARRGDASVPFTSGASSVGPGAPTDVYGPGWIRDALAGPDDCVALVEVEGDVHDLDEVYGERCDAVEPSRIDDTAARFFSVAGGCDSQRSLCTTTGCERVAGQPAEWFTLFP